MDIETKEVVIYTQQFKIEGRVKVTAKGYRGRISDFLNQEVTRFIPVLEPRISRLDGGEVRKPSESVLVNKGSITLVFEGLPEKA